MKKRFWIYILFLVAITLMFVLFWHRPIRQSQNLGEAQTAAPTNVSVHPTNEQGITNNTQKTPTYNNSLFNTNRPNLPQMVEKEIEMRNVPIDLYGEVIDQNSNPVPEVSIKAGVRHWTKMDPAAVEFGLGYKEIHLESTTGADGRFEISGATGDAYGILLNKDGYILSPKTPRGFGGGTIGSFESPVIFKMWKKGAGQHLVSHDLRRVGIPVDGSEVQFDLLNGTKVQSGGQFIVRVKRDPQILPPAHTGYNWSAEFEIPNGGLVTNDDEFMYSAPTSGYQEMCKIEMFKGEPGWTSSLNQTFYIELENGAYYGTLTVNLLTFHSPPPIILNLEISINPSGSRNLQPSQ
jgi:hypothetical protein